MLIPCLRTLSHSFRPVLLRRPVTTATATAPSPQTRPLPRTTSNRTPLLVALGVVGVGAWIGGIALATNYQRLSSSVVHGTLFTVRYDPCVKELLGEHVDYADSWPWISGSVNHLQGKIDITFTVKGDKGKRAEVHFASRRRRQEWVTLDFSVKTQDGETLQFRNGQLLTDTGEPLVVGEKGVIAST
ncbi:hypothetical protein BC938DRAFT_475524 [Jimgerdemannia flammicorona]|uniref:Cytochrome oxidase complex assembly protein 1-domain-containing protein n=1 Tax=Jimgerdemannia flammicorona TaxID=994334 RepID=A0A433PT47_9FUNG|nr:hypothetical protein BC938DRAFT_475524 [Jimgerdemannia flammicorona]